MSAYGCWPGRWSWVYCVFSATGECLYVGLTVYPGVNGLRWKQHRKSNPAMVAEATRCRLIGPFKRAVGYRVERQQIHLRQPRFNQTHLTLPARDIAA